MNLEYKSLPLREMKTSDDGGQFEGLAAAFFNPDDSFWPDILAPGCFAQDLPEFVAEGFVSGINHDWDAPIGKPLEARETAGGLFVRASISDTTHGRDVRTLLRDGVVKRLSIGFRVLGRTWLETLEEVQAWWRERGYAPTAEDLAKAAGGVRLVTRVRLYEFGPVAVPANKRAVITGVKGPESRVPSPESRVHGAGPGTRDPGPGTRFDDHSRAVLASVGEWVERARQLADLRARDGRGISGERLAEVRRLLGALESLERDARAIRSPAAGAVAAEQLYSEFLALEARG